MVFKFKNLSKIKLIVSILGLIVAVVQGVWAYFSEYQLLFGILSGLVIFAFIVNVIRQKKDWIEIIINFVAFFFPLFVYAKINFSSAYINYLMPLQTVSISMLYLYIGGDIYEFFWNRDFLGIKKYWESLSKRKILRLTKEFTVFLGLLVVFHTYLTFVSVKGNMLYFYIHHLLISILLVILFIDYTYNLKNKLKGRQHLASYFFHFGLILFLFDTVLEEIKYLTSGTLSPWIIYNFIFIYIAIRPPVK